MVVQAMHSSTVLMVDGNEADVRLLRYVAQTGSRFQVDSATTGGGAVEYLRSHAKPALVILDYSLGMEDGCEVLQQLRRTIHLSSPVVFLTGHIRPEVEKAAMSLGIPYFEKPMHLEGWSKLAAQFTTCLTDNGAWAMTPRTKS